MTGAELWAELLAWLNSDAGKRIMLIQHAAFEQQNRRGGGTNDNT